MNNSIILDRNKIISIGKKIPTVKIAQIDKKSNKIIQE
jgi:hypothetical protein